MRRKAIVLITVAVGAPLVLALAAWLAWRAVSGAVLDQAARDEVQDADCIVVFGAAIAGKGQPSAVLAARVARALELYRAGRAGHLVLTGGVGWGPPAESVVMKRILVAGGVPETRIDFETLTRDSRSQVEFAAATMKKRGWTSALLVSDPLHMYRLKRYFRPTGLAVHAAPARSLKLTPAQERSYLQMEVLKLAAWTLDIDPD